MKIGVTIALSGKHSGWSLDLHTWVAGTYCAQPSLGSRGNELEQALRARTVPAGYEVALANWQAALAACGVNTPSAPQRIPIEGQLAFVRYTALPDFSFDTCSVELKTGRLRDGAMIQAAAYEWAALQPCYVVYVCLDPEGCWGVWRPTPAALTVWTRVANRWAQTLDQAAEWSLQECRTLRAEGWSKRRLARRYGLSTTTLKLRLEHGARPGPGPALSAEELEAREASLRAHLRSGGSVKTWCAPGTSGVG